MKHRREEDPGLIFDWHRKEARAPWLATFLLLTFFGIASLFIIFRIVTPDAPRMIARPQQMILLNPEVAAERALIHRAMDRSFTLLPNESPTFSSLPSAAAIPAYLFYAFLSARSRSIMHDLERAGVEIVNLIEDAKSADNIVEFRQPSEEAQARGRGRKSHS
jgi:hypothetical protein